MVQVLPGARGIRQAYDVVLKARKADIICLSQNYEAVIGDYFEKQFAPQLYGKVTTREVLPDAPENRTYAKTKDASINQVRFSGIKATETDLIVTENRVVMVSFNLDSPMAVVVDETELVKFFKHWFEDFWNRARE